MNFNTVYLVFSFGGHWLDCPDIAPVSRPIPRPNQSSDRSSTGRTPFERSSTSIPSRFGPGSRPGTAAVTPLESVGPPAANRHRSGSLGDRTSSRRSEVRSVPEV